MVEVMDISGILQNIVCPVICSFNIELHKTLDNAALSLFLLLLHQNSEYIIVCRQMDFTTIFPVSHFSVNFGIFMLFMIGDSKINTTISI